MAVKKLIEVALPLDAINEASAREKNIRFGHPSTLHLWWARRPLASARAVIWASLVDDPSSHPELFPSEEDQNRERQRLFSILEELVIWKNSNDSRILDMAKAEIKKYCGEKEISLLDPFAGGGAIPLEAQRLGLTPFAQDLNPVAVTLNKAMIEIPPLFSNIVPVNPKSRNGMFESTEWGGTSGLANDVEYYAHWIKDQAYARIGDRYPKVKVKGLGSSSSTAIAWIWARTIKCPNPACAKEAPLMKTFDLSRKKGSEAHIEPILDAGTLSFAVKPGKSSIDGTVNRQGATCAHCGAPISFEYIRSEGQSDRINERMAGIIAEAPSGRYFSSADRQQIIAAEVPRPDDYPSGCLSGKARVNVSLYGFDQISDLFTNRQLLAMTTFSGLVREAQLLAKQDAISAGMKDDGVQLHEGGKGATAYGEAIGVYLALIVDKLADRCASVCSWDASPRQLSMRNVFGRQAIAMAWDFAEANPFSSSTGSFENMIGWVVDVIRNLPKDGQVGSARQFDAQSDNGMREIVVSTDPPYYDNIDYADLSDFFYVWLRSSLRNTYPKLYSTMLVPKSEELVATPYRFESKEEARNFFEEGMLSAFRQVNKYACSDIPVTIYYAFKQSETETVNEVESTASTGWETMLSAIIRAGFMVTGTWPMRTEMANRSIASGANALASSIVLVCRKRSAEAPMCTRRDFVNALKRELKPALDKLQTSNIAPVDLAQSAIGPGIGVYSRFSKVLEADGTEMTVRSALQIINQELDVYFSDQDGDLDKNSRFCVDLYTQNAFNDIRFGEADVLARAKNTSIEGLASRGVLFAEKGIVRLKTRDELSDGHIDHESIVWLVTQRLTKALEEGGISACAEMVKDVYGTTVEHAKALAYRLFTIADKKGWNAEAFAYNNLVVAWPEIQSKAAQLAAIEPTQATLFDEL